MATNRVKMLYRCKIYNPVICFKICTGAPASLSNLIDAKKYFGKENVYKTLDCVGYIIVAMDKVETCTLSYCPLKMKDKILMN